MNWEEERRIVYNVGDLMMISLELLPAVKRNFGRFLPYKCDVKCKVGVLIA